MRIEAEMNSTIRILLIDDSEERIVTLTAILNDCGYDGVISCSTNDSVLDFVNAVNPHVILIDVLSPTRDTLEQLTTIRDEHPTPVVLLSQDDRVHTIEEALRCGVTAYISNELSRAQAKPIINTAMITFATFQHLKHELDESKQKLVKQKHLDRAKKILMDDYGVSEEIAYHKIRKFAMDQKKSMGDVAKQIIDIKKLI